MPLRHEVARRYSSTFMSPRSSDHICRPKPATPGRDPEIQDRSARTSRLIASSVVPAILALSRVQGNRRPVFVLAYPPLGLPLMTLTERTLMTLGAPPWRCGAGRPGALA